MQVISLRKRNTGDLKTPVNTYEFSDLHYRCFLYYIYSLFYILRYSAQIKVIQPVCVPSHAHM